jgi:HYR domain
MRTKPALTSLVGAAGLTAGLLAGMAPAQASTGACDEGVLSYRISSPAQYGELGGHAVVIGNSAPTRTVTFTASDGSGCSFEPGDRWSVDSHYFHAAGTYDGTAGSLQQAVTVSLPGSDLEVGTHEVTATLHDVSGNTTISENSVTLKRRTNWRSLNVYPESPTPACGTVRGDTLHGKGQLMRASWSRKTYLPFRDRTVRLLDHPAFQPVTPGHTADDIDDITVDLAVTDSQGWARFTFKPPFDAMYFAHYGGNSHNGHSDSTPPDLVDCAS